MESQEKRTADVSVRPIGYVHASESKGEYLVQIDEQYREALKGLNGFGHVVIFWWANHHDNSKDRSLLTTRLPYARGVIAGVFACRSEYRPNPIGMTVSPILSVQESEGIVVLPWIDAWDGTPVLDLKPYMPVSDRVREVKVADWLKDWPVWMEDAGDYFASHQTDFGE